jgi:hypothetical protein
MYSQDFLRSVPCWQQFPDFCNSSNPDGFFSEKWLTVSSVAVDSTTLALSGEDDVPSPPEGAFSDP